MGCMAQRLGEQLLEHEAGDIVVGPGQIPQIPQMLADAIGDRDAGKHIAVSEEIRAAGPESEAQRLDEFEAAFDSDENHIKSQAFVRVMRGCNTKLFALLMVVFHHLHNLFPLLLGYLSKYPGQSTM